MLHKLLLLIDPNTYIALNRYAKGYRKKIIYITLISMSLSLINIGVALATKRLIDLAVTGINQKTRFYVLVFILLLLLNLALQGFISYYRVRVNTNYFHENQLQLIRSLYRKDWLKFQEYKTGDYLTRLYDDIESVAATLLKIIPTLLALLVQIIVAFCVLAYYDFSLALLTFIITPITLFLSILIGQKLKKIQHQIQEAESEQRSKIQESLLNLIIIKTYQFTENNIAHIKRLQDRRFFFIRKRNITGIKANILLEFGYSFAFFFAIAIGAFRLSESVITIGTFAAFIQLVEEIQGPINAMSGFIPNLVSSLSSLERLEAIYNLESEDFPDEPGSFKDFHTITTHHLSFHYPHQHNILDNINLTINKGDKIAIIGSSGEGKTTFIHLLLGLLNPTKGDITIQQDTLVHPLSPASRELFSYVSQNNTLFSGTIEDNFLLQQPATQLQLEKALKTAQIYDYIQSLENGLQTVIHERGGDLSQGQAQRLCIARALIQEKPILIFDEATSALDQETERHLIRDLMLHYPNQTLIFITHREEILNFSTIVYKLEQKKLVLQ